MALVECPECGGRVSTLAAACPHCGFPLSGEALAAPGRRRGPSRWTDPGFWVILVGLAAVIVVSILLLRQVAQDEGADTTVPITTGQALVLVEPGEGRGDFLPA